MNVGSKHGTGDQKSGMKERPTTSGGIASMLADTNGAADSGRAFTHFSTCSPIVKKQTPPAEINSNFHQRISSSSHHFAD